MSKCSTKTRRFNDRVS